MLDLNLGTASSVKTKTIEIWNGLFRKAAFRTLTDFRIRGRLAFTGIF
jgi:hypothetical protein